MTAPSNNVHRTWSDAIAGRRPTQFERENLKKRVNGEEKLDFGKKGHRKEGNQDADRSD
jgi:hypothetical protein